MIDVQNIVSILQLTEADVRNAQERTDLVITGVAYHSQKVKQGDIFVCIRGYKTDGHHYIPQAVANGAAAIVVEEFQASLDVPQFRVTNGREALATLAATYYGHPSRALHMIGITATNGKTTSAFMTNAILESHKLKTGLIGTVSVKIGDVAIPADLTTPESLELQQYLRHMVDEHVTHVTMEVSSAALEAHRVDHVDYDIVTLNNVDREHIDHHGTFERYFAAKSSLIRHASASSVAILNLDCPYSASLIDKTQAQVVTIGLNDTGAHIVCKDLDLSTGRAVFTLAVQRELRYNEVHLLPTQFRIELKVPGLHSVYNAMVAIAIALVSGVPIATIQESLSVFTGVERRFEFVFEDTFKIIDDHFANTGNIDVTLGTLQYMDYKKLHLVYAIRGMRGPTVNRENAEAIARWAQVLGFTEIIATKSKYHVSERDVVTDEEERVFLDVMAEAGLRVKLHEELPSAIAEALDRVEAGDLILLAGCQGMDFGAEIALQLLAELRPHIPREELFAVLRHRVAGVTHVQPLTIGISTTPNGNGWEQ